MICCERLSNRQMPYSPENCKAWDIFKASFIAGSDEMDIREIWNRNPNLRRRAREEASGILRAHTSKENSK